MNNILNAGDAAGAANAASAAGAANAANAASASRAPIRNTIGGMGPQKPNEQFITWCAVLCFSSVHCTQCIVQI